MTTTPTPRLALLLAVLVLGGCGRGGDDPEANDPDAVDDETRARVAAVAGPAAGTLARTLSGELLAAMEEGGPVHAIEFCARDAMELTGTVAGQLGAGWEVKRTARRTRNPANAPDALEARALERFHDAEADGGLDELVQHAGDDEYRYYRPLRIAPLCLQCHGDAAAMDPDVRAIIAERYPEDAATGYGEGELRGLIRVTVPAAALE